MKIAVCVPHHGDVKAAFALSLANMLAHSARAAPDADTILLFAESSIVIQGRNNLVARARAAGAEWILWLDSDQSFPADTLVRLLAHDLDVVGCNYARRCDPTGPTAVRISGKSLEHVWTTPEKAEANHVERVFAMGLGVCLMRMSALARAEPPLFWIEMMAGDVLGEDIWLFRKLAAAGVEAWVDHGLSWQIGHVGEKTYGHVQAIADRGRWTLANMRTPPG